MFFIHGTQREPAFYLFLLSDSCGGSGKAKIRNERSAPRHERDLTDEIFIGGNENKGNIILGFKEGNKEKKKLEKQPG